MTWQFAGDAPSAHLAPDVGQTRRTTALGRDRGLDHRPGIGQGTSPLSTKKQPSIGVDPSTSFTGRFPRNIERAYVDIVAKPINGSGIGAGRYWFAPAGRTWLLKMSGQGRGAQERAPGAETRSTDTDLPLPTARESPL
ncbi:MAG: hypothetical protein M3Q75_09665 [Gemmatimonadota bacterium]|nr:hypothetical protein [Gemmatimonadota bacterium]